MTLDELVGKLLEMRETYGGDIIMYTDQCDRINRIEEECGDLVGGVWKATGLAVRG